LAISAIIGLAVYFISEINSPTYVGAEKYSQPSGMDPEDM